MLAAVGAITWLLFFSLAGGQQTTPQQVQAFAAAEALLNVDASADIDPGQKDPGQTHPAQAEAGTQPTGIGAGYPRAISWLMLAGLSPQVAALWLAALSYAAIPAAVFLLVRRLMGEGHRTASISAAVVWLITMAAVSTSVKGQLDTPFIALTLWSGVFLLRRKSAYRFTFLAGGLAAVALSVQHAGIFWILACFATLAWDYLLHRCHIARLLSFSVPSFGAVGVLLLTDKQLTDAITRDGVQSSVTLYAKQLVRAAEQLLGIDHARLTSYGYVECGIVVVAALAVILSLISWRNFRRSAIPRVINWMHDTEPPRLLLLYPLIAIIGQVVLPAMAFVDGVSGMLLAVFPLVLILVAAGCRWLARSSRMGQVIVVAGVLVFACGQLEVFQTHFMLEHDKQTATESGTPDVSWCFRSSLPVHSAHGRTV